VIATFLFTLLSSGIGAAAPVQQPPDGFRSLLNGTDLQGWKAHLGKIDVWGRDQGILYCDKGGGGWLLTEEEFDNFEIRFEFRWSREGGNSGLALRTPFMGNPAYQGMEIQLIDDENWAKVYKSELKDYQHTGSIYEVKPAVKRANQPIGEWNQVRAICDGRKVTIELNGMTINEADLDQFTATKKNHPGLARTKGSVGFQSYNHRVEFRNIWIKELK
jgi:hypothetical protein